MIRSLLAAITLYGAAWAGDDSLFRAIRANDCKAVKRVLREGASPNARDASGATALMHAALYAAKPCMQTLIESGADVNAQNKAGATALMWAVYDLAKVQTMLGAGADPNIRSKEGRTALLIAARQEGSLPVIQALMRKGADANATDAMGGTALMLAAEAGDLEVVKLLVERGANVNQQAHPMFGAPRFGTAADGPKQLPPDLPRPTALLFAAHNGNADVVRYLLDRGADPKAANVRGDALTFAARLRDPAVVNLLLAKGADPHAREFRGATPLIIAAASDDATPATVKALLAKGADLSAKTNAGETAQDWAAKRGATRIVKLLGGEGQVPAVALSEPRGVREAVDKSLSLLASSGVQFVKKSGCISCHHNSIAQIAFATARARGFSVNEESARYLIKATLATAVPHRETMLQAVPTIPASSIVSSYALVGMAAEGHPADATTDALVHELAARQRRDGRWIGESGRPPLDQGDITATALTMRSLQLYPLPGRKTEFERRVARARDWLERAEALTNQEKTMRLLGLAWAKAKPALIQQSASGLLAEQREDGGWAQLATLTSDAYATGMALVALHEAGALKPSDPAYRRGVSFLLRTQQEDGSWHVKSRALGFQPYFESGYPHGHDQWISAAGAAWATTALALTQEPVATISRR